MGIGIEELESNCIVDKLSQANPTPKQIAPCNSALPDIIKVDANHLFNISVAQHIANVY